MLINLIISEFAIAFFGVPFDLVGSITKGEAITKSFCLIQGFIHTFFGKRCKIHLEKSPKCQISITFWTDLKFLSIKYFKFRHELFVHYYGNGYRKISVCCEIGAILAQQYQ